jgi:hypothetical protein
MYEVQDGMPPHGRITIQEPSGGWSRRFYERELARYEKDRGVPPRTITLHPKTMEALGYSTTWVNASEAETPPDRPTLVSSPEYDPAIITLYE